MARGLFRKKVKPTNDKKEVEKIEKELSLTNNVINEDKYSTTSSTRPASNKLSRLVGRSLVPNYSEGDFQEITKKVNDGAKITQKGFIKLNGEFSSNEIIFPKFDITKIQSVDFVDYNFVLKVINYVKNPLNGTGSGKREKLFTSSKIYQYLQNAYNRNLPYAAFSQLVDIVEVDLRPIIDKVRSFKPLEEEIDVVIKNNVGVKVNEERKEYEIDYDILLKYIDWVVSPSPPNYDEKLISVEDISDVELLDDIEAEDEDDDNTTDNNTNNQGDSDNTSSQTTPIGGLTDCTIVQDNLQPGIEGGPPESKVTATCNGVDYVWNGTRWFPETQNNGEPNNQGGSGNSGGGGGFNDLPGRS